MNNELLLITIKSEKPKYQTTILKMTLARLGRLIIILCSLYYNIFINESTMTRIEL